MNLVGVHYPGHSLLHRMPAGAKLVGLLVAVAAVWLVDELWTAGLAVLLAAAVFASAGVPLRWVARPLRALLVLLVVLGLIQCWVLGPQQAFLGVARLAVALIAAWTVSLTTRVSDMLAVLVWLLRPLWIVGVDKSKRERAGLTVALAIRCVPLLLDTARQANEARLARGHRLSVRGLAVPVVVRSLRTADALGDALIARGYGNDHAERDRYGP